ncbi:MAG: tetratricopeptide repeat protein [Bacteroidetes bacterium]|nr:tetratricopeptide repeat protein [Bacteroidota bacterium]
MAKDDTNKVNAFIKSGKNSIKDGDYDKAKMCALAGLTVSQKLNFDKGTGTLYRILGAVDYYQGRYPDALQDNLSALKIAEKTGDKRSMAKVYSNIGAIYTDQLNYNDAIFNLSEALKIQIEIGDSAGISIDYNNIGTCCAHQGKYNEALSNHLAALKIKQLLGDSAGCAASYINIGVAYYSLKNFDAALKNQFTALNLAEQIGDNQSVETSTMNIGNILVQQKKFGEAGKYLDKGLQLAKETGDKFGIKTCYFSYTQMDSAQMDFHSALEHYKLFILYRDSLNNEENTKKTVQTQMQYDFDKKSSADSIKNSEQKKRDDLKHTQEIQQQKIYTYGGALGFLLMLIVAIVSIRAFRNKQRANEIISRQKELVEEKQKEILDSIHYAKRIQQSLLPNEKYILKNLNRSANRK